MMDVEAVTSYVDGVLMNSCYFVFVSETDGTSLEKEVIFILKTLSIAVGKKFVVIISEDSINEKKKLLVKGGTKGTKASVDLPVSEEEIFIYLLKEAIIEYLRSLEKSSQLANSSKVQDKKKTTKTERPKIELNNLIDDRPAMSPDLFVVLVGFDNPDLITKLVQRKYPVKCIVKLEEKSDSVSYSENPMRTFWEAIDLQVGLDATEYFVKPLNILPLSLSDSFVDNLNYIYDILCCVLYEIVTVVREYGKYAKVCHLYPLDYIPMQCTPVYDYMSRKVPMECANEEYVLHCIIEQVIYFDEKRKKILNAEEIEVMNSQSDFFNDSPSVSENNIKVCSELNSEDYDSLKCEDTQLPFLLDNFTVDGKYKSRTFQYKDKYARSTFHLEQFPRLYLILTKIAEKSVEHLKKMPHELSIRKKSFFTFHVNRVLKHVQTRLQYVKQRQMKYYLELMFISQILETDFLQAYESSLKTLTIKSTDTRKQTLKEGCIQKVSSKYEDKENTMELNMEESLNECTLDSEQNNSGIVESDNTNEIENIHHIYMVHRKKQLKDLVDILFLSEFRSLIKFINRKRDSLEILPFGNHQVEHHDMGLLVQILHEERFVYAKYKVKYFPPTDSFLIIFYNPTNQNTNWSSSNCLPALLNINNFFKSDFYKPKHEINVLNSLSASSFQENVECDSIFNKIADEQDSIFAYDIGEYADMSESENILNENGLTMKIKKFALGKRHYVSATLEHYDFIGRIYCHPNPEYDSSTPKDSFDKMKKYYALGDHLRLVLANKIIINIYKKVSNEITSDSEGLGSQLESNILSFTITFPNGLFIESVQIDSETVIRQSFTQNSKNEVCRYYFRNGKVLTVHENNMCRIYHGNGDKASCTCQMQQPTSKSSEMKAENLRQEGTKDLHETEGLEINVLEHSTALGKFKRFEKDKMTVEYQKYSYKYACSFNSGELYVSSEDGVQLHFLALDEENSLTTKFDNTLTFSSVCFVSNEYYKEDLDDLNMDDISIVDETEDEPFVLIEQIWKIESETFAPITFSSDGKCEIILSDLKLCYEDDHLHIINENMELNATVDAVKIIVRNNGQETKVSLLWDNISEDLIKAERADKSIFSFKTDGSVLNAENDRQNGAPSDFKCFVIYRDGSGYQFVDEKEVLKHENMPTTFKNVKYELPNCNVLHQTNIQRKVKPLPEQFLFTPKPIRPVLLTRDMLKTGDPSNDWLFYPTSDITPEVKFATRFIAEHYSIEVRKFEQIIPPDIDIVSVMAFAFQAYCDEASSLCQRFGLEDTKWLESSEEEVYNITEMSHT